ncbi:MAG: hypothetical protein NC413_14355 [Muribaculum sp.]|nr:hypothetical protein [Muribaculum sp.]
MEYIWYIIAALGAGIGTGLAGLSAATVMVPILIVLCPSFAGETGAYHATAIALASDVIGSAGRASPFPFFRADDRLRNRLCRLRGRNDDAGGLYRIFRNGSENRCWNQYIYYDLYGTHSINQPYYDRPVDRF